MIVLLIKLALSLARNSTRFATASPGGYSNYYIGNYVDTKYIYEEYIDKTGYAIDCFITERDYVFVNPENLVDEALHMEGLKNQVGTHAAGVIIAPQPMSEIIPVALSKEKSTTTQYPMAGIEKIGLLKMMKWVAVQA